MRIDNCISEIEALMSNRPYLPAQSRAAMVSKYCGEASDLSNEADPGLGESVVSALSSFGIESVYEGIECGPVLTRVYVRLGMGIRLGSVEKLSGDLALSLRVGKVSVVPVYGRGLVAIDIPSAERKVVLPGNLDGIDVSGMSLPIDLGVDVSGRGVAIDLAKAPHMLVAGCTGSGKSVFINNVIASLLKYRSERDYQLMLIDPKKGVELGGYRGLPNVINHEVLGSAEESVRGLRYLVNEMDRRYVVLAKYGKRNIKDYNKAIDGGMETDSEDYGRMPYIVCVVDEFADLMLNCGSELTDCMMSLAQKSRAVGIHVILATQRPSVDVVTGSLKANLPCCVAFKVSKTVDSMTILGCGGAEKLLGNGDMLVMMNGLDEPMRLHGAYYSDESLAGMVEWVDNHTCESIDRHVDYESGAVSCTYYQGCWEVSESDYRCTLDHYPASRKILGDSVYAISFMVACYEETDYAWVPGSEGWWVDDIEFFRSINKEGLHIAADSIAAVV